MATRPEADLAAQIATTEPAPPDASSSTTTTTTVPANASAALARLRSDPRIAGNTVGVSVWIDGLGEVASQNADVPLVPASNQKLLTAIAALRLLGPQERLHTELVVTGPVVDGTLQGDIVIVGGGDPTVTLAGEHGLEVFSRAIADAGIRKVTGRVLVDDSRYDDVRRGQAWPDDWATYAGSMSALVADRNRYRTDDEFVRDPALGHAAVFRFALTSAGIEVAGGVAHTTRAAGVRVAVLDSPTVLELVTIMLFRSDNLFAELLLKEVGYRATHEPGTTAAGVAAMRQLVQGLCLVGPLGGVDADGSGLSYDDRRSARELRRVLLAVLLQPWGAELISAIPLAGTPDAIGGRLVGPRTSGNVRAKGGSLAVTRSLSGYLTTASGRHVVFSVIVNGPRLGRAEEAIDEFVTNLASLVT